MRGWRPGCKSAGLCVVAMADYEDARYIPSASFLFAQVPDVDAVLHTADFPCVKRSWSSHDDAPPLPLFGYQGSPRHHDLPFPDFTFWGNEHSYLMVGRGIRAVGQGAVGSGRAGECSRAETGAGQG